MPTAVHERFIAQMSEEILRQLSSLASKNHPLAVLAGEIKDLRSTSIIAADREYGRHDPDVSLARGNEAPSVVFEVLYSQKRKGFTRLVNDYILGSDGGIRAVIALDIDYHGRMAKLEMWRPCIHSKDDQQILEVESAFDNLWYGRPSHLSWKELSIPRFSDTMMASQIQTLTTGCAYHTVCSPLRPSLQILTT